MISGYHYSINSIEPGVAVMSSQTTAARWKFVFPIYKEIIEQQQPGFVLEDDFAYCYPDVMEGFSIPHLHLCSTEAAFLGNCQFSPLMALHCRLKKTDEIIEYAKRYVDQDLEGRKELIGRWVVEQQIG